LKVALLFAVLLAPVGCSPKVPVLPGLISEIAIFDGWYTPDGVVRVPFKGGREDGQAICKILLAGTSCDNAKRQGRGALTLTFAGPKTQGVELAGPEPVMIIDGQSYLIRMDDLMAILERLAPPPPKSGK
jgi:hypothetical protein